MWTQTAENEWAFIDEKICEQIKLVQFVGPSGAIVGYSASVTGLGINAASECIWEVMAELIRAALQVWRGAMNEHGRESAESLRDVVMMVKRAQRKEYGFGPGGVVFR